jgi:hypothetical protein
VETQTAWIGDGLYVRRPWERTPSAIVSLFDPPGTARKKWKSPASGPQIHDTQSFYFSFRTEFISEPQNQTIWKNKLNRLHFTSMTFKKENLRITSKVISHQRDGPRVSRRSRRWNTFSRSKVCGKNGNRWNKKNLKKIYQKMYPYIYRYIWIYINV